MRRTSKTLQINVAFLEKWWATHRRYIAKGNRGWSIGAKG